MANFRSRFFVKMAGTRLVPPHSLAFRPEWYPRVLHPTPRRHLPRRCGQKGDAAPRGYPPSGALQHAVLHHTGRETEPGGLPHQTHILSEVPRCANSFLLGAYRYKNRRPRPPTRWTDVSQSLCYTLRDSKHPPACSPSGRNTSSATIFAPSPRSRSAGIKVARPRHWKFTSKEAVTPLNEPTLRHRVSGYKEVSPTKSITPGRLGNKSRKTASRGHTVAHGVTRAGLRVLHNSGIVPNSHSTELDPANVTPERPSIPSSISQ
jgi:hypothetical protein